VDEEAKGSGLSALQEAQASSDDWFSLANIDWSSTGRALENCCLDLGDDRPHLFDYE
jgi:hypothetical protein